MLPTLCLHKVLQGVGHLGHRQGEVLEEAITPAQEVGLAEVTHSTADCRESVTEDVRPGKTAVQEALHTTSVGSACETGAEHDETDHVNMRELLKLRMLVFMRLLYITADMSTKNISSEDAIISVKLLHYNSSGPKKL